MTHWVRVILEDAMWQHRNLPEHIQEGLKRVQSIIESSEILRLRTIELEEIADAISVCDNLIDLSKLLWRATTSCGFQNFSLFVLNTGNSPIFKNRFCSSHKSEWLNFYEENKLQYSDPILAKAAHHNGSFSYSKKEMHSPLTHAYWKGAEGFGIGQFGFCYARTQKSGARLAISFSTASEEECFNEAYRLNQHDLEAISILAMECFCFLSAGNYNEEEPLSEVELKFLHILATSSNPETALSQNSIYGGNKSIQSSIRKKLNVETIFQAIAIASSKRWFDSLPYYKGEIITPFPKLSGWNICDSIHEQEDYSHGFNSSKPERNQIAL